MSANAVKAQDGIKAIKKPEQHGTNLLKEKNNANNRTIRKIENLLHKEDERSMRPVREADGPDDEWKNKVR